MTWGSNPSFRWFTCPRCGAAVLDDTSDPRDSAHDRRCRSLRLRLRRLRARLLGDPARRVAGRWSRRAGNAAAIDVARGTLERVDGTSPSPVAPVPWWVRGWGNLKDRD